MVSAYSSGSEADLKSKEWLILLWDMWREMHPAMLPVLDRQSKCCCHELVFYVRSCFRRAPVPLSSGRHMAEVDRVIILC